MPFSKSITVGTLMYVKGMLVGHVAKVLLQKLLKDMYPRYDSHIFAEIPMGSEHKRNNSSTSYLGSLLKSKWGNI